MWPWQWRKVRKAQISKEDRDLFERYGEAVVGSILGGATCPTAPELQTIIPGNICLPENPGKCTAARDWLTECRDAHERREQRLETIEIGVVALISIEIILSLFFGFRAIRDGREQAKALAHTDASTAATATAIQEATAALKTLAEEQAASLRILQQEQADRAKKPRLALYVGNIPIDKVTLRLASYTGRAQDTTFFDLLVKNEGDAPINTFRLHALTPKDVWLDIERLVIVPEFGPPDRPTTQRVTLQLPLLPVGETAHLQVTIYAPKGNPAFKISFTLDALELQTVVPLGSLTVLPPKP